MKAHIGVDAESGLVHTVIGTAASVNDVTQGHALLHGEEAIVFAEAGYQGAPKDDVQNYSTKRTTEARILRLMTA
jgi:IS5 family transposase